MIYARGNPARWWRSRSCGSASRAPGAMFISPFRRVTSISALVILLVLIFGLWYMTNPSRMARLAEALLSNVVGGRVTVKHAQLSMSGTLLLSGVELHTEDGHDANPGGFQRPLPLFSADQIEARFDWLSLLSGQLTATQLTAIRPRLYLVEDTGTEQWNYERMPNTSSDNPTPQPKHSPGRAPNLPVIVLRDALVMVAEVQGGEVKETSQTVVDGQLTPDPNFPGSYRFQVSQHGSDEPSVARIGVPVTATLPPAPLPAQISGTWDVWNNRFTATTDEIRLDDRLCNALPRQVREWWRKHELKGALSELRLSFDNDSGLVVGLGLDHVSFTEMMQPQPAEGNEPAKQYAVPLAGVTGNISFGVTKPGLRISKMRGKVMGYAFEASGDFRGMSGESPFDLNVLLINAELPHEYPPLFIAIPPMQDLLQRVGAWGRYDLSLSVKRLSWNGRLFFDGLIDCHDAHLRFCHMPYPLEHLNGQVHFDNDTVTFKHVAGTAQENNVLIDGSIGMANVDQNVDLTISSTDTMFDERVADCLPEKFKAIWDEFSVQGHGQFTFRMTKYVPGGAVGQPTMKLEVLLDDGRGYMRALPYRFDGVKGRLFFEADQTTLDHLTMRTGVDDSGSVMFSGVVKHPGGDVSNLKPELHVTADVPIDKWLLGVFPEKYQPQISVATVSGRMGFDGTLQRNEVAGGIPAQIAGVLTVKNGSLKMNDGGLTLADVGVEAKISGTAVELNEMKAVTAEGLHLGAKGTADIGTGTGKFVVSAKGVDVVLPKDAPGILPADIRETWAAYKPAGVIDLAATATLVMPKVEGAAGDSPFSVEKSSVKATLKKLTVSHEGWPDVIGDIDGVITATPEKITLEKLHGASGPLSFDVDAMGNLKTGAWTVSGAATSEGAPVKWFVKLPAGLANFLAASKPAGQFKVSMNHLDRAAADKPWIFDGTLSAATLTSTGPLSLGADRLSINASGRFDPAASALDVTGVLAGTGVVVSGKTIDTLTAKVTAESVDKSLKFTDIDGKVAGGALQGSIVANMDDNPRYKAELSLSDVELARLMLPATATEEERKRVGTGRVSATLNLQETFGDAQGKGADRTGRGELIVRDGKIYNLPLAMGLMQVVTLRLPVARAFDRATMSYYLRDDTVTFERILLESPGINLAGLGTMSMKKLPPSLDLNFITESPNEFRLPVLSEFVDFTRSELLQLSVTGTVDNPKITPTPLNAISSTLRALLPKKQK